MKKATKINLTLLALVLSANGLYAQQGFGTNQPSRASVIDLQSDSKGLLIPRVSLTSLTVFLPIKGETATNVNKTNSLLVYNTATVGATITPGYYYWTTDGTLGNSFWKRLLANDDASALALAGDVTGTLGATVVSKIQGIPVTNTPPTNNQVLTYNGSAWTPTAISPATITGKGTLTTQGGIEFTASTDGTDKLLGNATIQIADLGVTTSKLAGDAVTNGKLADNAVQTENIADSNVTAQKLTAGVGAAGRVAVADANGVVTYTNALPSTSISGQDVTAASNKITLAGTNIGAALKAFSIDVNEANFRLNNIGGTLDVNKITSGANNQVLTTNGSGATVWADKSSLITGVSNTSSGNSLTTTVNGTTGAAVNIINSNALTLNASNQLISTVNGVPSASLDLSPAIKANQQNTIVQGTGAITVPAAVVSGNNSTYTVGVATATSSDLGVVRPGTGLAINSGVLSVDASAIGKTLTGSGITVTAGSTVGTGTSLANTVLADVTLGIADNAINSNKIANGTIQAEDLNTNIAGNGLAISGNVLQVNANNGLTVDATADAVQLGGNLTKSTTITQNSYPLTIATGGTALTVSGLPATNVTTDRSVVADANGVLKTIKQAPRFFYMPAVIFDTSVSANNLQRDLYQDYVKQFTGGLAGTGNANYNIAHGAGGYSMSYTGGIIGSTGAPADIALYGSAELYYYITYYDTTVFAGPGGTGQPNITADGKLNYSIIGTASPNSYMNIVFVVRE